MEKLFASRFETSIGTLRIVSSEKGLVYVELPHANGRGFAGWMKTHAPDAKVIDSSGRTSTGASTGAATGKSTRTRSHPRHAMHEDAIEQLLEYDAGTRREFQIDLDLRATAFQKSVYKVVAKIGYGETLSYSDIAQAIGNPKAVRAVGAANGANPIPLVIPCHRVIARGGALQGYAGGLDMKARLLAMESAVPETAPEQPLLF